MSWAENRQSDSLSSKSAGETTCCSGAGQSAIYDCDSADKHSNIYLGSVLHYTNAGEA